MRRIGIAATAAAALTVIALVAMWAVSQPTEAATGDGLRTIIADRTGTACASIDVDGNHSGVGVGLAFDGTNLLITCYDDNTVTVINPADGSQVAAHFLTGASSLGAIAYDAANNRLWGCSASNTVGTIDLAFNSFTTAFSSGGCFDGLAYDGADDTIWASGDAQNTLRHYQTDGTQIGGDFDITGKLGSYGNSGIAVGGDQLYLANNGGSQIYQCDKGLVTCTLMSTFQRRLEDLECDNVTFDPLGAIWSIDAYDNILNAWEIPAGTCVFGGAAQPTPTPTSTPSPTATSTPSPTATPVPSPAALPPTGGQPSGGSGSLPWLAAIGAFALMSVGAWLAYQRRHAR